MASFEQQHGLYVPVETPDSDIPDRDYGPLELLWEDDRQNAHDVLTMLLNVPSIRGGGLPGDRNAAARQAVVLSVARLLLGEDFEYEELC